jgi:proteasome lid subunit RPN8/RPN11
MIFKESTLAAVKDHAQAEAERSRECCGLVIIRKGKQIYIPCRNIGAADNEFVMSPEDFADAEDQGEIVAVVHSHIGLPPIPSQADLVGIENTQLPWLIINMPTGQHTVTEPSGYVADLVGREFSHGVLDCYSLIRDYYSRTLGIQLKDYERDHEWWRKGQNLYRDLFADAGFVEVSLQELREHDVIFMRLGCSIDNHGAIYIGNNQILHHPMKRLSGRDTYGGMWRKITSGVVRHKDLR